MLTRFATRATYVADTKNIVLGTHRTSDMDVSDQWLLPCHAILGQNICHQSLRSQNMQACKRRFPVVSSDFRLFPNPWRIKPGCGPLTTNPNPTHPFLKANPNPDPTTIQSLNLTSRLHMLTGSRTKRSENIVKIIEFHYCTLFWRHVCGGMRSAAMQPLVLLIALLCFQVQLDWFYEPAAVVQLCHSRWRYVEVFRALSSCCTCWSAMYTSRTLETFG